MQFGAFYMTFKLFYCITILGTMVTLAKYFREYLLLFTAVTLLKNMPQILIDTEGSVPQRNKSKLSHCLGSLGFVTAPLNLFLNTTLASRGWLNFDLLLSS